MFRNHRENAGSKNITFISFKRPFKEIVSSSALMDEESIRIS